jgi:hypothetical protein
MTDNKLTDRRLEQFTKKQFTPDGVEPFIPMGSEVVLMACELQQYRKSSAPELKMANLINKFYKRYPFETFKSDSERSEALGYFIAGAELQCFGGFVKYEDLYGDE